MSDELNRINPTVVEGAEDIHGAEGHDAEMYSPLMQNKFAFRDAMRRSRDTLTEKQVGDLMRMRRFGRGAYGAESKFDELSDEIAEQYEKKGMSKEEAEKIGDATAYKVGVAKYGKRGMARKAKVGMDKKKMKADYVRGSDGEIRRMALDDEEYKALKSASNVLGEIQTRPMIGDGKERYLHDTVREGLHVMIRDENQKRGTSTLRAEAHEAEGLGNILGEVIPQPHFMGMEEIIREKNKNQNMKDAQGYDDKLDESMGMSMRESKMKQSMKDRRDESKGMEKGMGRRAYQRVKTMDMDAQGYDDKLDESMGMSMKESKMKQSMKDRRDESKGMEKGMGRRAYQRVKTMDMDAESFEANEEAVEQTDANMVNEGSVDAFYGSGAKVDTSGIELQPIANPSVDEAFDVGNDVGIDVAEQEVMNINPSVEVNYGAEGYGEMTYVKRLHHVAYVRKEVAERPMDKSFEYPNMHTDQNKQGKIWDDRSGFRKMDSKERNMFEEIGGKISDFDVVDTTQDLLAKGGVRVGGMTASALVIAIAGISGYYFGKR